MIILISGGIGSGKTLSAVKMCLEDSKHNLVFTNFKLKKIKNYKRLKWDNMLIDTVDKKKSTEKKVVTRQEVNWEFWKKQNACDIYLDEMHNIVDSRQSQNKKSVLFSHWLSQIRKIWGQSGDQNDLEFLRNINGNDFRKYVDRIICKSNNIICITQRVGKIDVRFREMSHVYIQCQKIKIKGELFIVQNYYFGNDNISAVEMFEAGAKPKKNIFHAPKYYSYYDSYELISVGGEYL